VLWGLLDKEILVVMDWRSVVQEVVGAVRVPLAPMGQPMLEMVGLVWLVP
jgi:hypothetical protein